MIGSSLADGRLAVVAVVNPRAQELGISAKDVLQSALPAIDGRGGGKDDIAQGGGSKLDGLDEAYASVHDYVRSRAGE